MSGPIIHRREIDNMKPAENDIRKAIYAATSKYHLTEAEQFLVVEKACSEFVTSLARACIRTEREAKGEEG